MSTEEKKSPDLLMSNLPECGCFTTTDSNVTWDRCCDVAKATNMLLTGAFNELAVAEQLCTKALPYMLDLLVVSILTHIAKQQGPALELGSQEIQWEVERLLNGMEVRILERVRDVYGRSRAAGLTEAKVAEMRRSGDYR